jgi:hypothetical protein
MATRSNVAEGSKDRTVAIVGIVSTATVALIGIIVTVYTTHRQLAHDSAVAHASRVYDRRSEAYLDAITLMERQVVKLRSIAGFPAQPPFITHPFRDKSFEKPTASRLRQLIILPGRDTATYARIVAFGSAEAVRRYERVRQVIQQLYTDDILASLTHKDKLALYKLYANAIGTFQRYESRFMQVVHGELS